MTPSDTTGSAPRHRIKPAPVVGAVVVVLYILVVNGLQLSTGIPYREWTPRPATPSALP